MVAGVRKMKKTKSTFVNIFITTIKFFRHDQKLVSKYKPTGAFSSENLYESKLPTQQFGASLGKIKKNALKIYD